MKTHYGESRYLKAADVPQPLVATIQGVTRETVQQGQPPKDVVSFTELPKPLVLNDTNGITIQNLYSNESDNWLGRTIEVFATTTFFNGKQVACIRVRQPQVQQPVAQAAPMQQPAVPVPQPTQQHEAPVPPQPPIQAPPSDVPFDA